MKALLDCVIVRDVGGASTRIRLCGPLVLEVDGEHREGLLRGRQQQLLFTFLVLRAGIPVRREELLEAIATAGGRVPRAEVLPPVLSKLRTLIAPVRLEGRTDVTLVLPPGAWVDVEAAQFALTQARDAEDRGDWASALDLARQAQALTATGVLPGHEAAWLDAQRADVQNRRVEALELAARAGGRLGGASLVEAEQYARSAVAAAPFRESARAELISILHARGNTAEALRAFDEVRVLLRDELGVTPGTALLALHEELLRSPRSRPSLEAPRARPRTADLEERGDELANLVAAVDVARAGYGRLVVIEGPAGVGKTSLLGELRARTVDRGVLVLSARGGPLEQAFPFGVVRQLLESAMAEGEISDDDFGGAAAAARAVLSDGAPGSGVSADAFVVLNGIFGLVRRLAEQRPVAVCVDDLHWCDQPSLRFLSYLARRIEGLPLLVAATLRTGDPGEQRAEVGELVGDLTWDVVRPRPLGPTAVARLVAGRLGTHPEPAFAAACHEVTGGNPLLVGLLLGALAAERIEPDVEQTAIVRTIGARAVSRMVLTQLARLTPDAVTIARTIAVLGDGAEIRMVADLAGVTESAAAAAAGVLVHADVLRAEDELGFVHPLVADAVYRSLTAPERDLAHLRAARALADRAKGADRIAAHLLLVSGRQEGWVVEYLRSAARLALARGAPDSAVSYLERALAEPPEPARRREVLLELGRVEVATSGPMAVEHLRAAADGVDAPQLRAEATFELARVLLFFGRADEARELAMRAQADLPPDLASLRDSLRALSLYAGGFGATSTVDVGELPTAPDTLGAARLILAFGYTRAEAGWPSQDCLGHVRRAMETAELFDDDVFWPAVTVVLTMADRHGEASKVCRRVLERGRRRGSRFRVLSARVWHGYCDLRSGRLDAAQDLLERAIGELTEWGTGLPPAAQHPLALLAEARLERDDLPGAARALDGTSAEAFHGTSTRLVLAARTEVLLAHERPDEALDAAEQLADLPRADETSNFVRWRPLLARCLAGVGRSEEALRVAHDDVERALRWGVPSVVGRTRRVLGELQGDHGAPELRLAVSALEESSTRLEYAKALAALGLVSPKADRIPLMREALAHADRCGAARLARQVRAAPAATGHER